jgi:hypothetical protein
MDYDFLYNLKLKDTNFNSKLGFNFSSRHRSTYMAEFSQSLSSPQKLKKIPLMKKCSTKGQVSFKAYNESLSHYSSLSSFREKLSTPSTPSNSKHFKKPSQDASFGFDQGLSTLIPFQTLVKASDSVKKSGVKNVTFAYKRQLKEFCLEFLNKYKEN